MDGITPVSFYGQTHVLTGTGCEPLPVFMDGKETITCWRVSWWKRIKMLFTGKIWISVRSNGYTCPALFVTADALIQKKTDRKRLILFFVRK